MFSEATQRLVRQRARGVCECVVDSCPHYGRCRMSGRDFHHKKAIERGGTDDVTNCQFLCASCHQRIHGFGGADGVGRL